jgi:hypothetical protein
MNALSNILYPQEKKVTKATTQQHFIDHLETSVDWNKVFGVVDSLYGDDGFTSNADNFTRATAVERALDRFSGLVRVDQDGYDFMYGEDKIELKMGQNLFQKRNPFATKKFKVKSFLSEKKTIEDYRTQKTFDYMIVLDLTARRVVVVEDEYARSLYEEGADGAMIKLDIGNYYECKIGTVESVMPPTKLSDAIEKCIENYLDF